MDSISSGSGYAEKYRNIFVKYWSMALNIGVDENTSFFDRKRTRILNGICVITIIAYFGNTLSLFNHRLSLIESLMGMLSSAIIIYLNYLKKYSLACHAFNIWNICWYTFMGIIQGANDATEMYLIPSSVASMLFFRETSTIVAYFVINFASFCLAKYSHNFIAPINVFPGQAHLYISNYILFFGILFLIILHFKSENAKQENLLEVRNKKLKIEKRRSDELLLNILPAETAEELKMKGSADAKEYNLVTVLFTDFKDFTNVIQTMSAQELVNEINYCYSGFDRIVAEYGIEKIKTIGDGYMAAGGLPAKNFTNPEDAVNAAISIRNFMDTERLRREKDGKPYFEIRIGLHTGPVVAGIVGIKKFAYDIWGDTVNIASRMESSGEVGKINISGHTYELVKDRFQCTYRGKVMAKNKGEIDMYFVENEIVV